MQSAKNLDLAAIIIQEHWISSRLIIATLLLFTVYARDPVLR